MNTLEKTMKYKLVVSDFDGTLAFKNGTVSDENVRAIKAYTAAGGKFTIATGRMYPSIVRFLKKLGLDGDYPIASYDGSIVTKADTGKRMAVRPMSRLTVLKIVEYCEKRGIHCQFYTQDYVYTAEYNELIRLYAEYSGVTDCVKTVGKLSDYLDKNKDLELIKTLIISDENKIDAIEKDINLYMDGESVFVKSASRLTECVDNLSGKGNYVSWIADYYGIPVSEIAAIGDSMNDASMLKTAGLGVAMADGDERLKKIAGYITDECGKNGFAAFVNVILRQALE